MCFIVDFHTFTHEKRKFLFKRCHQVFCYVYQNINFIHQGQNQAYFPQLSFIFIFLTEKAYFPQFLSQKSTIKEIHQLLEFEPRPNPQRSVIKVKLRSQTRDLPPVSSWRAPSERSTEKARSGKSGSRELMTYLSGNSWSCSSLQQWLRDGWRGTSPWQPRLSPSISIFFFFSLIRCVQRLEKELAGRKQRTVISQGGGFDICIGDGDWILIIFRAILNAPIFF